MARLWPLVALPFALAGLAASLVFQSRQQSAAPASVEQSPASVRTAIDVQRPERPVVTRARVVAEPAPPDLVAAVRSGTEVEVRTAPRGPIATTVGSRTEFGSARALGVVERRGAWLGVTLPELGNGRLGWIERDTAALELRATRVRIDVDLSARRLALIDGGRVVRTTRVSIGAAGSPTPTGRFAVTDKLPGSRFSTIYGCCILALSGRQPNLPAGWQGGDRLAIHGAPAGAPIGSPVSAGCLHASEDDLQKLMRRVPVGAPVVIHA